MAKVSREQIILAARELFRDKGYAGASMGDLAAAVGLKKASLYSHFNNKEELVPAALALTLAELDALNGDAPSGDWQKDYGTALHHVVVYLIGARRCVGLHLLYGTEEGLARDSVLLFFRRMTSFFTLILRRGLPAPLARAFAEDTIAALEGATIWLALRNDPRPIERAARHLGERLAVLTAQVENAAGDKNTNHAPRFDPGG
jgi:TetR/AcrR family transcriptional repressor of nem operon